MAEKKEDTQSEEEEATPKKASSGFLFQIMMAVVLGAVAFAMVYFMPPLGKESPPVQAECPSVETIVRLEPEQKAYGDVVLVKLEDLVVSLAGGARPRHLKIGITLEAAAGHEYGIDEARPRLQDAFTGYLRAIHLDQLEDPMTMAKIKAQLLRRARVVLGVETVAGLLITDFVLT